MFIIISTGGCQRYGNRPEPGIATANGRIVADNSYRWLAIESSLVKAPGFWLLDLTGGTLTFLHRRMFLGWTHADGEVIALDGSSGQFRKVRFKVTSQQEVQQLSWPGSVLGVTANDNYPGTLLVCGMAKNHEGNLRFWLKAVQVENEEARVLTEAPYIDFKSVEWPASGASIYWRGYRGPAEPRAIFAGSVNQEEAVKIADGATAGPTASANGRRIFWMSGSPARLHMLELPHMKNRVLPTSRHIERVKELASSANGDRVVVSDIQSGIWPVDVAAQECTIVDRLGMAPVWIPGEDPSLIYMRIVSDGRLHYHEIVQRKDATALPTVVAAF